MLCYLSRNYYNSTSAGNKAKSDYEDILAAAGARNIGLGRSYSPSKIRAFALNLAGVAKAAASLRRGDTLVLQYPVKKYFGFMCRVARLRGARTVTFIHDLGSFRRRALSPHHEIARLSQTDAVISANEAMSEWLRLHGLDRPIVAMGLHDYLSDARPQPGCEVPRMPLNVVYAGSLNARKNSFLALLCALPKTWDLHIFGNMPETDSRMYERVTLHPYMDSDAFISHAGGGFGLVWDGDSLEACTGCFGEYLRYNSPHKASFYLRAGMPLIVWSQSALAPIVKAEGIGLAVESLTDLDRMLAAVTEANYEAMRRAVGRVSERLASGGNFMAALSSAME